MEDDEIEDPWSDGEQEESQPTETLCRPNFTPRQTILHCLGALDAMEEMRRLGSYMMPREGWKEDVSDKIKESLEKDPQLAGEIFDLRCLEDFSASRRKFALARPLLHWACCFDLPLQLIQHLHELCPSACQVRFSLRDPLLVGESAPSPSSYSRLPVQEALQYPGGGNFATIQFLLDIYPESVNTEILKGLLTSFPLTQSKALIRRFLRNEDEIRAITKLIPVAGWTFPNPLPLDLLKWVAGLHNQSTFSIIARVAVGSNFEIWIDESSGRLIVGLECDASLSFCLEQLTQMPNLKLTSIEISNMDHIPSIHYFISALTHDPNWMDDPFGAIGGDPETQRILAQLGMLGFGPPPASRNGNPEGGATEGNLDLSSIEHLKIDSVIGSGDIMDELLDAIVASLPNLRILGINGRYNLYEGLPNIPSSGFAKLPLLAHCLVELEVSSFPQAATAILELLQSSRTLKKLHFINSHAEAFTLSSNDYSQLNMALSSTPRLDGSQRVDCTSSLSELCEPLFLETLVRSLQTNTSLKRLHLKKLRNAHCDGASLLDLVRHKKNITLEEIVVQDPEQTSELEFWCEMNHLEPILQTETIELREAIPILTPYLSTAHHDTGDVATTATRAATKRTELHSSILYSLIRCRPDLWTPVE